MRVFDRERADNCVSALPFLLSRRLARLLTEDVPVPFLFSSIFYFMAGFDRQVDRFFTFFAISLLNHFISVNCALFCVTARRRPPSSGPRSRRAARVRAGPRRGPIPGALRRARAWLSRNPPAPLRRSTRTQGRDATARGRGGHREGRRRAGAVRITRHGARSTT